MQDNCFCGYFTVRTHSGMACPSKCTQNKIKAQKCTWYSKGFSYMEVLFTNYNVYSKDRLISNAMQFHKDKWQILMAIVLCS